MDKTGLLHVLTGLSCEDCQLLIDMGNEQLLGALSRIQKELPVIQAHADPRRGVQQAVCGGLAYEMRRHGFLVG